MQLVIGESVLISETLESCEALRVAFEVADERGQSAPSVVVDERGVPLTNLTMWTGWVPPTSAPARGHFADVPQRRLSACRPGRTGCGTTPST